MAHNAALTAVACCCECASLEVLPLLLLKSHTAHLVALPEHGAPCHCGKLPHTAASPPFTFLLLLCRMQARGRCSTASALTLHNLDVVGAFTPSPDPAAPFPTLARQRHLQKGLITKQALRNQRHLPTQLQATDKMSPGWARSPATPPARTTAHAPVHTHGAITQVYGQHYANHLPKQQHQRRPTE